MNNIKKYRKEKGMTLKELAEIINISVGYLCHLEKGSRKNPSCELMEDIAKALNHSIEDVFFPNDKGGV